MKLIENFCNQKMVTRGYGGYNVTQGVILARESLKEYLHVSDEHYVQLFVIGDNRAVDLTDVELIEFENGTWVRGDTETGTLFIQLAHVGAFRILEREMMS